MIHNTPLKAIDFFSGAGGVTAGFKQAGINVLAGIDVDSECQQTYEINNKTLFINEDITNLTPDLVVNSLRLKRNDDSLIYVGCSPCQYYSKIQTSKEKSSSTRLLLDDFLEHVAYANPGFVFIENVPGFEKNPESPIGRFKKMLEVKGYIYRDGNFNVKEIGVPQSRLRYILLATRLVNDFELSFKEFFSSKTVRDAIGDYHLFPPITAGHCDYSPKQHTSASLSKRNLQRLKKTPHDGGNRISWQTDAELQLDCYRFHTGHTDVYGRMYWDRPSPTITTKFRSLSNGRFGHPEQDRAISIREGATLQTFDSNYVFYSDVLDKIARMIGNAVPPRLAYVIARNIQRIANQ